MLVILKASSIGFAVGLICLIIPIVHILTGPLAPAIGGFVGAVTISSRKTKAPLIGILIGIFWSTVVLIFYLFRSFYPNLFSLLGSSIIIPFIGVFLWASILGTVGALIASNKKK